MIDEIHNATNYLWITWVNCGPAWDNDTARSPQTGEPLARRSRDLGVMRKLSNLHLDNKLETSDLPKKLEVLDVTNIYTQTKSIYQKNRILWLIKAHRNFPQNKHGNSQLAGEENLDVIWYNISERSSFCSKFCCIVANPIRRGSRSPTRQLFISTPFFCLGFTTVGFASNNRSFNAPTSTAWKLVLIAQKNRGIVQNCNCWNEHQNKISKRRDNRLLRNLEYEREYFSIRKNTRYLQYAY